MKYTSLLQQTISYIEEHLHEEIGLHEVANAVGYSYYHITRISTVAIGEPVVSYILKRRLYEASRKLIYGNDKIIDIALECGFKSPEAFSRAFKMVYECSPSMYRKGKLDVVSKAKKPIDSKQVSHVMENITLVPEIETIEELSLIGIRGDTTLKDNQLPRLWKQYIDSTITIFNTGVPGYSICETENATYTKDGDMRFSMFIGSPHEYFSNVPINFVHKKIRSGKYAVFTHRGGVKELVTTYNYIWGTWALLTKEKLDDRENFEYYNGEQITYHSSNNTVKIYIPIK